MLCIAVKVRLVSPCVLLGIYVDLRLTPTLGGPAEKLVRARIVYAHDDLLPYRPVVLHLGVFPFVADAVRVRVVLDHGGGRRVPEGT